MLGSRCKPQLEFLYGGGTRCTRWPRRVLVLGEMGTKKSVSKIMSVVVGVTYKVRELHLIIE